MNTNTELKIALEVSDEIKLLALEARKCSSISPSARQEIESTIACPIGYIRYAEFEAVLRDFELSPEMKVLDVGSPQWFSIYLAKKNPAVDFYYINIIDRELEAFKEIASALDLENLQYQKEDVRDLNFNDDFFDRVVSISVIEHIYPEKGGDLQAFEEIRRVLKSKGDFFLTVPYKDKSNIVYEDGPVYERNKKNRNFYAREYDSAMFSELIRKSQFDKLESWFIIEKKGVFSLDYYIWGPGENNRVASYLIRSMLFLESLLNITLDKVLAKKYLVVSKKLTGRVVNICARLGDS